jgi:ribonuclease P protein component
MFKKQYRINKKKEYDNVFKNGRSNYNILLGIKYLPNLLEYNRFGIIVGGKISKSAVKRNLIKRRIREALKSINANAAVGYDIVIIALPEILNKNLENIKESLEKVLKKARLTH